MSAKEERQKGSCLTLVKLPLGKVAFLLHKGVQGMDAKEYLEEKKKKQEAIE